MKNKKKLIVFLSCWLMMTAGLPSIAQEVASPKQEKAALKKAKKIRKVLIRGADFASLAAKHSDDPVSAQMGGELGFVSRGQLVSEYEKAVDDLEPGQLSEPVRTQFGFHLIELIERKEGQTNTRHILIKP